MKAIKHSRHFKDIKDESVGTKSISRSGSIPQLSFMSATLNSDFNIYKED